MFVLQLVVPHRHPAQTVLTITGGHMSSIRIVIAMLLLVVSLPATAQQPRDLKIKTGSAWSHKPSGIKLPASLLGADLRRGHDLTDRESDVYFRYWPSDENEEFSVYIYRLAGGSIPVWFDRAQYAISTRAAVYGQPSLTDDPLQFTLTGDIKATGLIATYRPTLRYTSTVVAMLAHGEWIVKLRYSSRKVAPEQARARTLQALEAIGWPRRQATGGIVAPIADCAAPLPKTASASALPKSNPALILEAGLISAAADKSIKSAPEAPVTWCRDPGRSSGDVYRPDGAADRYFLALSDAGRGVHVAPRISLSPDTPAGWSVWLVMLDNTLVYPAVDRMPDPDSVMQVIDRGQALASVTRSGKERRITLASDALAGD